MQQKTLNLLTSIYSYNDTVGVFDCAVSRLATTAAPPLLHDIVLFHPSIEPPYFPHFSKKHPFVRQPTLDAN